MEIAMSEDSFVAAIIGNNGSGKSNILEALTQIFSAVYNEKSVSFRYRICYSIYNDNFEISNTAVKKQSRFMKSVIKLDRNFHIYVHGNNQYIRKGYDEETGMNYYQLLFNEEQ